MKPGVMRAGLCPPNGVIIFQDKVIIVRGFDPPLIPHLLRNKNPLEFKGISPFGSDGGRSLTGYAILPRKTEYQQVVKAILAIA